MVFDQYSILMRAITYKQNKRQKSASHNTQCRSINSSLSIMNANIYATTAIQKKWAGKSCNMCLQLTKFVCSPSCFCL